MFLRYNSSMENNTEQNPAWLLIRASIPAKLAFAEVADSLGLTFAQLLILCLVDPRDEAPAMHTITSTLGCDASNVTGLVDKLVTQGLLERSESSQDRRAKIIELTHKGRQARKDAFGAFAKSSIFNNLTSREVDTLATILVKMLRD
jgi:DNA-binding MarR family transcriptional regulator